jgi:hypothetical protein
MKVEVDSTVGFHLLNPELTKMPQWQRECFAPVAHLELPLCETITKKDFDESRRKLTVCCAILWDWDMLGEWTTHQVLAMMSYFRMHYKKVWDDLDAGRLDAEPTRTILEAFDAHAGSLPPGVILFEGQGVHETDMLSVPDTLVSKRIRSTTYVPNVALDFTSARNGVLLVYRLTTWVRAISAQAVHGLSDLTSAWHALKRLPEGTEKDAKERGLMDSFTPWSHIGVGECELLLQPGLTLKVTGECRKKLPVFSKLRCGNQEPDREVRIVFVDVGAPSGKKRKARDD